MRFLTFLNNSLLLSFVGLRQSALVCVTFIKPTKAPTSVVRVSLRRLYIPRKG